MKRRRQARVVLDRIEGDTAVLLLEDGSVAYLPARLLPEGAKPGAALLLALTEHREGKKRPCR